jgi:hypothetical protein
MPSTVTAQKNGLFVKAYRGDAMTLLAMNMAEADIRPDFVGFTIGFSTPESQEIKYIFNRINFGVGDLPDPDLPEAEQPYTSTIDAPIQYFRWIHVPGTRFLDEQATFPFGKYTYYITPRFMADQGVLRPLDENLTCKIKIEVAPFIDGQIEVSFTRGFVTSQAFASRFGLDVSLRPDDLDNFNINMEAGRANGRSFTYREMYEWCGFQARVKILAILDEVIADPTIQIDVLAYDFNDPSIKEKLLEIARSNRMRMVLDDSTAKNKNGEIKGHGIPNSEESKFAANANQISPGCVRRTHFWRFAHCKVFILKKNGQAFKVLTGSTNFSINGLYINANHVVVIKDKSAANLFAEAFEESWDRPKKFRTTSLVNDFLPETVPGADKISFAFAPHTETQAKKIIGDIAGWVRSAQHSVLFAVMNMTTSTGELIDVLKNVETEVGPQIFKYGVSEGVKEVKFYKPGRKNAIILSAQSINKDLPPNFLKERNPAGMKIHHKFIVLDFDTPNARVICGSSNLALGGKKDNGDNMVIIQDRELATVFAIEAIRLVDHYHFRAKKTKTNANVPAVQPRQPPRRMVLRQTAQEWTPRFYDPNDLKFADRNLFCPMN